MTTTLNTIVYDIINTARNAGITDDERITTRQVQMWVNDYRSLLIRRDLDKARTISDNISQDLGCIETQLVDAAECCNVNSTCPIMRSIVQLPKPIELSYNDAITFVGPVDKHSGYEITSFVGAHWSTYNKYTSKLPRAIHYNGYIYITNQTFLKYINVQGIFEDPTEVGRFNTCAGDACYTANSAYPISTHMIPVIKQMIFKQELQITLSTLADETNDGQGIIDQPQRLPK